MKYLTITALTALAATTSTSTLEAAGWRSCKATQVNCTSAQTKVKVRNHRRAAFRYRDINSMPARDWFYRRMLDN